MTTGPATPATPAVGDSASSPHSPADEGWVARHGWILSAVWLVFLVFPLLGTLANPDNSVGAKATAAALLIAFAVVYVDGFRREHRRQQEALDGLGSVDQPTADDALDGAGVKGVGHFIALIALGVALYFVAGAESLGIVGFVVVFAIFHFPWPAAWAVFGAGLAVTAAVPLLDGTFGELWFFLIIVGGVGGAAVMIRSFETHQYDQAHLRTQLAVSDERTRVARDVHDVLGHSLTAVILKVELCQRLLDTGPTGPNQDRVDACRNELVELESISRRALTEIRSTVGGLRAADVGYELAAARTVLADAGVELLVTGDAAQIPEAHRPMLAWVVREAVTNIIRHARAGHCHIELAPSSGEVLMGITDDGVGLGDSKEGHGLRGLRERVESAGGRLKLTSPIPGSDHGGGTVIEVIV